MQNHSKSSGMTLLELILVVGIVAILVTGAVPSFREMIMNNRRTSAINELVGGFGVEGIEVEGEFVADYVNTGDTYSATILREYGIWNTSEYRLTTWGDWLQAKEAEEA